MTSGRLTDNEKRRALHLAITHFNLVEPDIADGLREVLADMDEAELKLSAMRFDAGEGPST